MGIINHSTSDIKHQVEGLPTLLRSPFSKEPQENALKRQDTVTCKTWRFTEPSLDQQVIGSLSSISTTLEDLVPPASHWKTWLHQHSGLHYLATLGGELCFSCASPAMKRLQCHSRLALSEGMSSRCCSIRGGKATVDIPDISSDTD